MERSFQTKRDKAGQRELPLTRADPLFPQNKNKTPTFSTKYLKIPGNIIIFAQNQKCDNKYSWIDNGKER